MADPVDIQRLLGDLAREGIVVSVDHAAGTARVEFAEELTTGDIRGSRRAGKTRVWSPPSVGEQVLVLAPEADAARGIIIGSLSSSDHPHPANDASTLATFQDGATISYNPVLHALLADLPADASVLVVARGGLRFTGDLLVDGDIRSTGTITGDGDVVGGDKSLKAHLHTKVQAGAAISGAAAMIGMDRRTGKLIAGSDHLAQSIDDILSTPLGTRLGRRDYGSLVPQQLDQPNNPAGRIRIFAAAALALLRQEGRVRISRVAIWSGAEPHQVVLTVTGRRTDVAGNPAFTAASTIRASSALA